MPFGLRNEFAGFILMGFCGSQRKFGNADVFFEVFTTARAEIAVFFVRRIATPSLSSRMESQFRTLPLLQNIGKRIPFLSNVQELCA